METEIMDLVKALCHQPDFKLINGAINIILYSKDPVAPNSLSVGG